MLTVAATFPKYHSFEPQVPVWKISRDGTSAIHRFYDTSPLSPSGRYIAFTEFSYENKLPKAGDEAFTVVIDLSTGHEVYRSQTIAWDTQLGAQVQWGVTDQQLFFNRMKQGMWKPYGVRVNIFTGEETRLDGPVYMISPDGTHSISPDLVKIWLVQEGYGVIVPEQEKYESSGAPADDGIYMTDTTTGTNRLLVSLKEIYDSFPDEFADLNLDQGGFYGFHTKWSPDGERIMFIIRWQDRRSRKGQSRNWIITMRTDGTDLKIALNAKRWTGGHHPNWCPDSTHIVMNLLFADGKVVFPKARRFADRVARRLKIPFYKSPYALRLATFKYDGSDLHAVAPNELGSGHPTWHEGLNAILTDAYPSEPVAPGDGTVPIRLIPVDGSSPETLIRIRTKPDFSGPRWEWRVDPHPAWNHAGDCFVFNACPDGKRGVYIADIHHLLSGS